MGSTLIATIVNKPEDFPYTPTLLQNTAQQFMALGIYTDGSIKNISSQVTWNSSNTAIATISFIGLISALADGTTKITASLSGITSLAVVLTVNSLSSVSVVTGNSVGVPMPFNKQAVGFTYQLKATGTYSDGSAADITSQVTWKSSNTAIATISSGGLVTNVSPGITDITASLQGITSPPVAWTVGAISPTSTNSP